jgi:putative endonuclease
MDTTKKKGEEGEDIACAFLKKAGYSVKERNWYFSKYEVDIIAEHQNTLVFVEVKYRSGNYFGEPEIFVSQKQKSNLIRVANFYIDRKNSMQEARFDIIAIVKSNGKINIKHIEDAFKPEVNQY